MDPSCPTAYQTAPEELLAYIQSPAGRRFLESAPIQQEADAPRQGAPVGPILTLGAGFVLAAIMAYLVSSRLGLFPPPAARDASSGNA